MGYIDDVESLPVNLKEVDLRTQNKDTCNLAVAKYYATKAGKLLIKLQTYFGTKVATVVTDNMICATNPGPTPLPNVNLPLKDTCQGDSGGPLFSKGLTAADDRVFGVTSWGPGCGIRAGVYVKLPNYNTWVQNQVTTLNSTIFEYAVRFTINCARQGRALCGRGGSCALLLPVLLLLLLHCVAPLRSTLARLMLLMQPWPPSSPSLARSALTSSSRRASMSQSGWARRTRPAQKTTGMPTFM